MNLIYFWITQKNYSVLTAGLPEIEEVIESNVPSSLHPFLSGQMSWQREDQRGPSLQLGNQQVQES